MYCTNVRIIDLICELILNIRQKALYILLTLFALFNGVKWASHFVQTPYNPLDFRTYYFSSESYWKGENPYSDEAQKKSMLAYKDTSDLHLEKHPGGFPHATAVYAPQFIWFFGIYNAFDFKVAKLLDFALNIFSIFWIILCIKKSNPDLKTALIALSILAFRGTWYALDTGQPLLQVFAICLWAFRLYQINSNPMPVSFLLAFVSFKFTLLLPISCLLFLGKDKRHFILYLGLLVLLNFSAILFHHDSSGLLRAWTENINKLWVYPHQFNSLNGLNIVSSNLSVALKYYLDLPLGLLKTSMAAILLACYIITVFKNKHLSDGQILLFLGLSNLCFGQHLIYDALILIAYKLIAIKNNESLSILNIALLLFLLLPIGSIADRLNLPGLNFGFNLLLFLNWIWLCWDYFFKRNKAIKNPS
jgi:hypothetical protein